MAEVVLSWVGKSLAGTSTFPELVVTLQGRFDQFEANVGGPAAVTQSLTGAYLGADAISIDYKTMDATP
jgi:hypothetical protein